MTNPHVVVAGAIAMDATITVDRHPRPGEEFAGRDVRYTPGGKGLNQAIAAARAGAAVTMIGRVGDDIFASQVLNFLRLEGINTERIQHATGRPTDISFITVDRAGENTIVYDGSCVASLSLAADLSLPLTAGDVLISQLAVPASEVARFFRTGRKAGALTVLNAAPASEIDPALFDSSDVIVINEFELAAAAHTPAIDPRERAEVEMAAQSLRASRMTIVVTLGGHGAALFDDAGAEWLPAPSVDVVDTTGAGDAFVGALGASLVRGDRIRAAAAYATGSASAAVTRKGASIAMPYRAEVQAILGERTMAGS